MAATRLAIAALRIPWKELLKAAPVILTASGDLIARLSKRQPPPAEPPKASPETADIIRRLEALESSGLSQAELTKDMAQQLKEVTEALRVVALRSLFAVVASIIGLGFALVAFIRAVFWP